MYVPHHLSNSVTSFGAFWVAEALLPLEFMKNQISLVWSQDFMIWDGLKPPVFWDVFGVQGHLHNINLLWSFPQELGSEQTYDSMEFWE